MPLLSRRSGLDIGFFFKETICSLKGVEVIEWM